MKLCKELLGVKVKIKKLNMPSSERSRLIALGIDEGVCITLENLSIFGSSMLVRVDNLRVVMRSELASKIEVENV